MEFDIELVISNLKKRRKIFASEADFQFELAWMIKEIYPSNSVLLEYSPAFNPKMHIDILVIENNRWIPIELKYKTKECHKTVNGTVFNLKNHSAKDVNCYNYLMDIQRIEQIKSNAEEFDKGYTVFITNELSYISPPSKKDCVYSAFSLENGIIKTGELNWAENTGKGTKKGHEEPIVLQGKYKMIWDCYSKIDDSNSGTFMYLINEIR